ncbi:MAG: phenylalanine--tRNA ligase subunit alpha [Candidatus Altiarchaeota archaeon]|nr:phenylalanine--tRNA ligase subunit alpha [Candidatus Altiarchaeota archaeon]
MEVELHPHEARILKVLKEKSSPEDIAKEADIPLDAVMRASSWLSTKNLVKIEEKIIEEVALDKEGFIYAKKGLPERRVIESIKDKASMEDLKKKFGVFETNIALGWLNRKKQGILDKGCVKILDRKTTADEKLLKVLEGEGTVNASELSLELKEGLSLLKKRKNVISVTEKRTIRLIPTKEGMNLDVAEKTETISQLTPEMLVSGEWKNKTLRPYDAGVYVKPQYPAKRHPLQRLIEDIRNIFTEMGFREITGPLVESAFWNFDALFQPQDHPARDMHDTFYLKKPKRIEIPDYDKYMEAVGKTHENGGETGSTGWGYKWSGEVAKKTLLRTHTTAVTCRYLSTLKKEDLPVKVFSIGKVFRNEQVDYKHLPEFYQVEGIVAAENVNFRNLLGILKEFYDLMGSKVRFRPGYFPYTEMSVEPEVYIEERGEWVELGGAGIFRPEVVKPLLGFECPVLAWGLGLDRVVALKLGLKDIRELYNSDLDKLRSGRII